MVGPRGRHPRRAVNRCTPNDFRPGVSMHVYAEILARPGHAWQCGMGGRMGFARQRACRESRLCSGGLATVQHEGPVIPPTTWMLPAIIGKLCSKALGALPLWTTSTDTGSGGSGGRCARCTPGLTAVWGS